MILYDDGVCTIITKHISKGKIMTDNKTYVYDNVEVKLTGRKAQKTLPSGKSDVQLEITPVHTISGSWKKWVREKDLFEIVNQED